MESIIGDKTRRLRTRLGISADGVRRELLGFLQASSKMTFAIRAHAFDGREAASLTALGQDMVRFRFLGGWYSIILHVIVICVRWPRIPTKPGRTLPGFCRNRLAGGGTHDLPIIGACILFLHSGNISFIISKNVPQMETQIDRARRVLGRQGVRLVLHMLLHLEQMVRDHGKLANIILLRIICVGVCELCDKRWYFNFSLFGVDYKKNYISFFLGN